MWDNKDRRLKSQQREAVAQFLVYCSKKRIALWLPQEKIYSNNMKDNRNSLIRGLLSGIANEELENLVRVRDQARSPIPSMKGGEVRRPIPTPRKTKNAPYRPIPLPRRQCSII